MCLLKFKLIDNTFQILEQDENFFPRGRYACISIESVSCPEITDTIIYLRGNNKTKDNDRVTCYNRTPEDIIETIETTVNNIKTPIVPSYIKKVNFVPKKHKKQQEEKPLIKRCKLVAPYTYEI